MKFSSQSFLSPTPRTNESRLRIARAILALTLFVAFISDDAVNTFLFRPLRRGLEADRETDQIDKRLHELAKKHITPRNVSPLPAEDEASPATLEATQAATGSSSEHSPLLRQTPPVNNAQQKDFIPAEKFLGKVFPKTEQLPIYLRNTAEPFPQNDEERDIIFFWHVPKTGGEMIKYMFGKCFGLRWAQKLKEPASLDTIIDSIVNVDTSTIEGIAEAQKLGLVDSNTVDFISSRYGLSASSLFTDRHRGRAFTVLRHPVDLAASTFFARKALQKDIRGMTLAEYVTKNFYIDNWMTRQLTGTLPHEELKQAHLDSAKGILSAKYFVGIYEQMEETVRQLKAYYDLKPVEGQEWCPHYLASGNDPKFGKREHPKPTRGSDGWKIVAEVEKWDMELYYLALELFSQQRSVSIAQEN